LEACPRGEKQGNVGRLINFHADTYIMAYNKKVPVVVFSILIILAVIYLLQTQKPQPVACTAEALLCPDASGVGRVPPDCRFAPCPNCACPESYVQEGSTCTPKCYYSTPKCLMASLECNTSLAVK
jgi:hypothetical protein